MFEMNIYNYFKDLLVVEFEVNDLVHDLMLKKEEYFPYGKETYAKLEETFGENTVEENIGDIDVIDALGKVCGSDIYFADCQYNQKEEYYSIKVVFKDNKIPYSIAKYYYDKYNSIFTEVDERIVRIVERGEK